MKKGREGLIALGVLTLALIIALCSLLIFDETLQRDSELFSTYAHFSKQILPFIITSFAALFLLIISIHLFFRNGKKRAA